MSDLLGRLARRATGRGSAPDRPDPARTTIAPRLGSRFERPRGRFDDLPSDEALAAEIEHRIVRPDAPVGEVPTRPPIDATATASTGPVAPPDQSMHAAIAPPAAQRPLMSDVVDGFEPVVASARRVHPPSTVAAPMGASVPTQRPSDRDARPGPAAADVGDAGRDDRPVAQVPTGRRSPGRIDPEPATGIVATSRPIAPSATIEPASSWPPDRTNRARRRPVRAATRSASRTDAPEPIRIEWAGREPLARLGLESVRDAEVLGIDDVADATSGTGGTVHVHVDRLEVQRPGPTPPPSGRPRATADTLGLDQYLEQRRADRKGRG